MREFLPNWLRRFLGIVPLVLQRSYLWFGILVRLRGKSISDQKVLRKAILISPISILSGFSEWKFPMVSEDCEVVAKGVGTFNLRASSDDLIHAMPAQEHQVEAAIRRILCLGDRFIDAGANVGFIKY